MIGLHILYKKIKENVLVDIPVFLSTLYHYFGSDIINNEDILLCGYLNLQIRPTLILNKFSFKLEGSPRFAEKTEITKNYNHLTHTHTHKTVLSLNTQPTHFSLS